MKEPKTKETDASVRSFLDSVEGEEKRKNAKELSRLMEDVAGERAKMWGSSMVGFGDLHYRYPSGREGDTFRIGFSPRKNALTIYLNCFFEEEDALFKDLGPHTRGKGCLYIKRLSEVDESVLRKVLKTAYKNPALPNG